MPQSPHRSAPPPVAALFVDAAERERCEDLLSCELSQAMRRVASGSVTPTIDAAAFAGDLAAFDFDRPLPLETVLRWVISRIEEGIVHITNPRYFGLFNPGPTFPSQCADRIVAAFNPQLATATTSPAAVAIEAHVIRSVAARAGLPPAAPAISPPAERRPTTPPWYAR